MRQLDHIRDQTGLRRRSLKEEQRVDCIAIVFKEGRQDIGLYVQDSTRQRAALDDQHSLYSLE